MGDFLTAECWGLALVRRLWRKRHAPSSGRVKDSDFSEDNLTEPATKADVSVLASL